MFKNVERDYKGLDITVSTYGELQKNGNWKVTHTVTHKRSKDLDEWEEKSVSMDSFSKDFDNALANATFSINAYLELRGYDLFSEPDQLEDGEYVQ